jgi:hypothetical protein
MATCEMALCLALSGLTATATAQTTSVSENWTPIGRPAQTITGRVTFTPSEITFQNGKSLPLARGGQMLFRPEAKKQKVRRTYTGSHRRTTRSLRTETDCARENPSPIRSCGNPSRSVKSQTRELWPRSPGRSSALVRPTTADATFTTPDRIDTKQSSGPIDDSRSFASSNPTREGIRHN